MLHYRHAFRLRASLDQVVNFHRQSRSMGKITPPPVLVRLHSAPEWLSEGDEMRFTLWLGPLPIHWRAKIEGTSSEGFIDRQLEGPFETWEHQHLFKPMSADETEVVDSVKAKLKRHPWWWLVGGLMWLNLPILFAYRGWKTRRELAQTTRGKR